MIRAGVRLHVHRTDGEIVGLNAVLGPTEAIHVVGAFEVWRTRAAGVWNVKLRRRIVGSAVYRIVKRLGTGRSVVPATGLKLRSEVVFVMRVEFAGDDWRDVVAEFVEQVEMLDHRER